MLPVRPSTASFSSQARRAALAIAMLALGAVPGRAQPAADPWNDYHIIMWQAQNAAQYRTLKRIGVDAGRATWRHEGKGRFAAVVAPFRAAGIHWYAENMATDFYSAYHRWFPDKPVNWKFKDVQKRYEKDPADPSVFNREPSLSDPAALARIRDRITGIVQAARPNRALFYNLADEAGIADLSAYWDFDLSAPSLAGMRDWLKGQYGTLDALNREWGTAYTQWDQVMPETTPRAMARTDGNFSAWADFKAWMDVAFARAVRAGTAAVHAADPGARAGLEGAQIPGWGGYDYTLLAPSVDVMEVYDYGQSFDIVRSLSPDTIPLTTLFRSGPKSESLLWSRLLRGSRGLILWDPKHKFAGKDGSLGPRGQSFAETFRKIRGGLGALLIASRPHTDPVAILYSPASFRTQWMLDHKPLGDAWSKRDAAAEYENNAIRTARRVFNASVIRLGRQPGFVSPDMLTDGTLGKRGIRVLILPHSIALSDAQADAIRRFVAGGGTVVADTMPGVFDAHSKQRKASPLADLFPPDRDVLAYEKGKAIRIASDAKLPVIADKMADILAKAGVKQLFPLTLPDGSQPQDVVTHVYRNGATTLVALQRRWTDASPGSSESVTLKLPPDSLVTDLMAGRPLGPKDSLAVDLGPVEPAIFAITPRPYAPVEMTVNGSAKVTFHRTAPGPEARPLHVEVYAPSSDGEPNYAGNVVLTGETAEWRLPVRPETHPGTWLVRVTDILQGTTLTDTFESTG